MASDANALGWSYDEALAARDAVQDARTAALDELAAENGITRGDEPDGGVRQCERNAYGFCRTCGIEMPYVPAQCECSGRDEFTRPESGYCPCCEGWIPVGAGRQA